MKSYAQNSEDTIVYNYFNRLGYTHGTVLDIGANDGSFYSNSRFFHKLGWFVHLVEPAPSALERLIKEYAIEPVDSYAIWPYAIGIINKDQVIFRQSGSLINKGDIALVSTFSDEEMKRWPNMDYEDVKVDVIGVGSLLKKIGTNQLDFITIDVEGLDLQVLSQFDFNQVKAKVVCVENNGKEEQKYMKYMVPFGFRLIHKNGENLIFGR